MNIVIEGIDASGKSTLARALSSALNFRIVESEGPPKSTEEMHARLHRYAEMDQVIFVRHPCVSDVIYAMGRDVKSPVLPFVRRFYETKPLFVYCDPTFAKLQGHETKDHDSPEHMAMVEEKYADLLALYQAWSIRHAHVMYRIGDDVPRVIRMCQQFDPISDIEEFHKRFMQYYAGKPRALLGELKRFRSVFMQEELDEYNQHADALEKDLTTPTFLPHDDRANTTFHLAEMLDALIDLTYVVLGTSHLQGFNFREGWRRVHAANMKKVCVRSADESLRHSPYDVIKPEGWTAPKHDDLVEDNEHN